MSRRRTTVIGEEAGGALRELRWPRFLRAPDAGLLETLYGPALSCAVRYDRCCAYFSSHVLAVAARGFGGLIRNLLELGEALPKPAVRLLVNEQLDPDDLQALLARGDESPLAEKLLKRLYTPQEALERHRLEALAWLAASGWLEVRVGLMRRTQGVLHAKFGLIADRRGDCLAFMGSDNETGEALLENYEELILRASWEDAEFVDHYRRRFEALWADEDEQVRTLPLPEAVRLKLIKLAPARAPQGEPAADREALATAMLWRMIAAAPYLPQGEYAGDATAPVTLWPHQRRVVEDTARAFPAGRLLCDEVGLGKTVEAIAILRRLLAGRGVRRALLLVPAGLLKQWQEELREKGALWVKRWEDGYLHAPDGNRERVEAAQALAENDLLLLSREWARLEANRALVLSAPVWDLVLVDEAHAARRRAPEEGEFNSANLLLQLLRELQLRRRARGILLLSATPMQTQPWEPWDLLAVLGVGGRWMADFADIRAYYEAIAALRVGSLDATMAQKVGLLVAGDPDFPPRDGGINLREARAVADALLFCMPGERAAYAEWLRRGAPLGRRMHRNTRETLRAYHRQGLLPLPPPVREVRDIVFDFAHPEERACYEAVADYIDRRFDQLERERPGKGFIMTIYRRRAASSPLALRRSLERRLERLERVIRRQWADLWLRPNEEQIDPGDLADADQEERIDLGVPAEPEVAAQEAEEVRKLLGRLDALGNTDSKLAKFWEVLREVTADGRAALVFSEYADTMEYLRDRLRPMYLASLGCYSGEGGQLWDGRSWVKVSKATISEQLEQGKLKVLVCTDAASEGLNLQAASALINYDLPWNPSKVEQRIGRIDRIGQRQGQLLIRNLFLDRSVDLRVYEILQKRCGLFRRFVGHMQPVLSSAWKALRSGVKPGQVEGLLRQLDELAAKLEAEAMAKEIFISSEARRPAEPSAPLTREELVAALERLERFPGKVRARRLKGAKTWQLSGLGKSAVRVTMEREVLEQDAEVLPLSALSPLVAQIAERLPAGNGTPLVLGEFAADAYRCVEARWVQGEQISPLGSVAELRQRLGAWDGQLPPPRLLRQAEEEAREAARSRAQELARRAQEVEEAALQAQREAARWRLLRELARTLRCLGSRDLNATFRRYVEQESRLDGRWHRALQLLGGYPQWPAEVAEDAEAFYARLTPTERTARLAFSELDAAIADPRWLAKSSA